MTEGAGFVRSLGSLFIVGEEAKHLTRCSGSVDVEVCF